MANSAAGQAPDPIAQLQALRFEGFTNTQLADEIDHLLSSSGNTNIDTAITALQKLSQTLADTDKALRDGLKKLKVNWHGVAGGQAAEVLTEQAGFTQDANTKISKAAASLGDQDAAFRRIRWVFSPEDADVLRKGVGGYNVGDWLTAFLSDHAQAVSDADEKKATVVQKFTEYANDSVKAVTSAPGLDPAQQVMTPRPILVNVAAPKPQLSTAVLRSTETSRSGTSKAGSRSNTKKRISRRSTSASQRKTSGTGATSNKSSAKRTTTKKPVAGRPKYPPKPCPPANDK